LVRGYGALEQGFGCHGRRVAVARWSAQADCLSLTLASAHARSFASARAMRCFGKERGGSSVPPRMNIKKVPTPAPSPVSPAGVTAPKLSVTDFNDLLET